MNTSFIAGQPFDALQGPGYWCPYKWNRVVVACSKSGYHGRWPKKAHVAGNLAKYMFFKMCRDKKDDRFDTFMRFAGRLYNPCSPPSSVDHDSDVEADDDVIFD